MKLSPFVRDLAERAVKSFLQGALAAVGLQTLAALASSPLDLSLWQAVGVSALGGGLTALFSFVTSVLSKAKTGTASASAVVAETSVPQTLIGQGPPITRKRGRHEAADGPTGVQPMPSDD